MNPELKAKWVAALRSGEYAQAQEALRKMDGPVCGYCCLGVLLDVSGRGEWDGDMYAVEIDGEPYTCEGDLCSYRQELGIPPVHHNTLVKMNDSGAQFVEIADYIEANL